MSDTTNSDPAGERLLKFFQASHLPEHLRPISLSCATLANIAFSSLPAGPEKTAGLRKLLEAKDCFVRAKLEERERREA